MRHKIGYRKLNKTSEHRKALFKNMLNSLIKYEQIVTTLPKAKELKPQIDKVITLGKKSNLSKKKRLFSKLQDQKSVNMDKEEVGLTFENYNLVSAGVVNKDNKLIGMITADDVVTVVQEEAEEDVLRLAGVGDEEITDGVLKKTEK